MEYNSFTPANGRNLSQGTEIDPAVVARGAALVSAWEETLNAAGEISVKSSEAIALDDAGIRGALPADAVALTLRVTIEADTFPVVFLVPFAAAGPIMGGDATDAAPDDAAREAMVGKVADLIPTWDGDAAVLNIQESTWSPEDPLIAGDYISAATKLTVGSDEHEALLAIHVGALDAAKETTAGKNSSEAVEPVEITSLLWHGTSAQIRQRITDCVDGKVVHEAESLDALVRLWSEEPGGAAIVEVSPGQEHWLPFLKSLTRFPGSQGRVIVVILTQPNIESVVTCGRLGLFNVLPGDFTGKMLQQKLELD